MSVYDWPEVYRRFDPSEPAQRKEWRTPRRQSPADNVALSLENSFEEPRVILLGTLGTGKTTEILRIADLRSTSEIVVVLDLVRHFNEVVGDLAALQGIDGWEVVFLAALALVRWGDELLPGSLPRPLKESLAQAWSALRLPQGMVPRARPARLSSTCPASPSR